MKKDERGRGREGEVDFSGNFLKPVFKPSVKVGLISRHGVVVMVVDSSTALKLAQSVSSLHFRQAAHNRIKNKGWWQEVDWSMAGGGLV